MKHMKRYILISLLWAASLSPACQGQTLAVPLCIQEKSQWCWAAASQSILGYYGLDHSQCMIAEYTRTVATWQNFGNIHCCSGACNYWNYLQGTAGSIQDILMNFGQMETIWVSSYLTQTHIQAEIAGNRPFVIRWGWTSGGGHFVVGHGIDQDYLMYMDPLYGFKIADYSWVVQSANHQWTSTLTLDRSVSNKAPEIQAAAISIFPNPASGQLKVKLQTATSEPLLMMLWNLQGQLVRGYSAQSAADQIVSLNLEGIPPGIYTLQVQTKDPFVPVKVMVY